MATVVTHVPGMKRSMFSA
ncbi:hypothetical protein Celaphus_00007847 [Cervus elaphus hippelaphus]|uniref:Uncharacterized protein n=1 Tax=Cervus elaphus hippelaphus TaxID=46360 RepID=A0A212CBQ1_CEREH|nr:hypothetical protein Celaphus_00007847 [Cervus elaphus hippelaphus]